MMTRYFRYVFCFLLGLGPSCFGQAITIRIVNATNGHPLEKQGVSAALYYAKGERPSAKPDALVHLETDVNGEARLSLTEPVPRHLGLTVHLTSNYWHCGRSPLVITQDLIQKGVTITESGQDVKTAGTVLKAKPGEILFAVRPFTFLERLFYPLVRD